MSVFKRNQGEPCFPVKKTLCLQLATRRDGNNRRRRAQGMLKDAHVLSGGMSETHSGTVSDSARTLLEAQAGTAAGGR